MAGTDLPWVLGVGASHNGAVCLLKGDEIVVAVQEERLNRRKRAALAGGNPSLALNYCLQYAGIKVSDLDAITICHQARRTQIPHLPGLNYALVDARCPIFNVSHHYGHAVGALATSGFEDAAILVIDGKGSLFEDLPPEEQALVPSKGGWETTSLYQTSGSFIEAIEKYSAPESYWAAGGVEGPGPGMKPFASLGYMYGAIGKQIFGDHFDGAGKVMGLAPYGKPTIPANEFFEIVDDRIVFSEKICERFKHDDRWPARREEYQDLAASVQVALEEALMHLTKRLRKLSGKSNLCYAGGVALNSVANERIVREAGFDNVFVMPAAEDSGTAIGAAYHGLWQLRGKRVVRKLGHDSVGAVYSEQAMVEAIRRTPEITSSVSSDVVTETARHLADGKIIGWFEGRSELGPRALGQRSILCDPRRPEAKDVLNARVKHREGFRPFAPVILLEESNNWFDFDGVSPESPSMLRIAKFREDKRGKVPGVVHVDGTGRVQTVTAKDNGRLYTLVRKFHEHTGVPIVLNTSFNVAGEPIVETPEDALWCLLYTGLDGCVLGDHIVWKRPGYSSVLDLTFQLNAKSMTVHRPIEGLSGQDLLQMPTDGRINLRTPYAEATDADRTVVRGLEMSGSTYVRFRIPTPWGMLSQFFGPSVLSILKHVDGKSTGRALLERVSSEAKTPPTEAEFIRTLGDLHRARILTVSA